MQKWWSRSEALLAADESDQKRVIGEICDQHGAALFSLASVVLGSEQEAEDVVVWVLADSYARPGLHRPGRGRRHELARLVYLRCIRPRRGSGPVPSVAGGRPATSIAKLRALPERERAAAALMLFGDHGYREIPDLLELSESDALTLLRSIVRDLLLPRVDPSDAQMNLGKEDRP